MNGDELAVPVDGNGAGTSGAGSADAGGAGSLPDITVAHQARVYNYALGGKDHFAADRAVVEEWTKVYPEILFDMRANRAFLGGAVRYLAGEAGMRQVVNTHLSCLARVGFTFAV
jgi:hypothetical protein